MSSKRKHSIFLTNQYSQDTLDNDVCTTRSAAITIDPILAKMVMSWCSVDWNATKCVETTDTGDI